MRTSTALKLVETQLPQQSFPAQFDFPELNADPYAKEILTSFLHGAIGGERRRANFSSEVRYCIEGDLLLRRAMYKPHNGAKRRVPVSLVLARRFNGFIVGNSSAMPSINVKQQRLPEDLRSGGRNFMVQLALGRVVPMVPFRVLEDAKLNIDGLQVVDFTGPEYFGILEDVRNPRTGKAEPKVVSRHFGGACLIRIDATYYLFDVDRKEIGNQIFNPFLSKLPGAAQTIAAAYEMLKPQAVKDAEKAGKECMRHGEWFFIPAFPVIGTLKGLPEGILDNGVNMSHKSEFWCEEHNVVTGKINHRWGWREHKDLQLDKFWYTPVPNTAVESFKVTGRVD